MLVRNAVSLKRHHNFARPKHVVWMANVNGVVVIPDRFCSTEQKIQEKIKNQQKIKQIKPPTADVPKMIVRLLLKSKEDEGPSLWRFTRLARAFGQAKFKVNDIEATLRNQLIGKAGMFTSSIHQI